MAECHTFSLFDGKGVQVYENAFTTLSQVANLIHKPIDWIMTNSHTKRYVIETSREPSLAKYRSLAMIRCLVKVNGLGRIFQVAGLDKTVSEKYLKGFEANGYSARNNMEEVRQKKAEISNSDEAKEMRRKEFERLSQKEKAEKKDCSVSAIQTVCLDEEDAPMALLAAAAAESKEQQQTSESTKKRSREEDDGESEVLSQPPRVDNVEPVLVSEPVVKKQHKDLDSEILAELATKYEKEIKEIALRKIAERCSLKDFLALAQM